MKNVVPTKDDLKNMTVDEIHTLLSDMNIQVRSLEQTINKNKDNSLRENFFIMKLATKDQELREAMTQIQALKANILGPIADKCYSMSNNQQPHDTSIDGNNACEPAVVCDLKDDKSSLSVVMTDPAINYLYSKLLTELEECREKLKNAEDELTGANFTLDSSVGRKLVSKCRLLQIENKELGKEFTEGRFRQLEIALKMERKHRVELEESFQDIDNLIESYETQIEALQSIIVRQKEDIRKLDSNSEIR